MIYALLAAIFTSLKDLFGKKAAIDHGEYAAALSVRIFPLTVFVPMLFLSGQSTAMYSAISDHRFLPALICGGALNAAATILYFRSIRSSDLSLVVPLTALTPAFLLATSPIFFGSGGVLSFRAASGVALVAAGIYAMNIRSGRGIIAPFRALFSQSGARSMLLVAFIWSITSNIDRIGVGASSPLVWIVACDFFIGMLMLPVAIASSGWSLVRVWKKSQAFFLAGTAEGIGTFFQMVAVGIAPVPAVIAMKRTSILWSALWGMVFFREGGVRRRIPGILMMLIGVACILL